MYVWNGFTVVGKRHGLTKNILATLEKAEEQLGADPSKMNSITLKQKPRVGFFVCLFLFVFLAKTKNLVEETFFLS